MSLTSPASARAEAAEEAVIAVEDEGDDEAVREVDGIDGESVGAASFAALLERKGKHSAASVCFLAFRGSAGTGNRPP
ncbi:hypothetical protein ACP70R_000206 [Stipagrostis hirtigluma subsp. patula]